jgi:hypothetical protein
MAHGNEDQVAAENVEPTIDRNSQRRVMAEVAIEMGRDLVQYPGERADAQRVVPRHRDVVLARRWWLG